MDNRVVVELLRHQRHDFSNHLQVILGYLDLEMYDRARLYLQDILHEVTAERNIFKMNDDVALFIFQHYLLAKQEGIILEIGDVKLNQASNILECNTELSSVWQELGKQAAKESDYIHARLDIKEDNRCLRLTIELQLKPVPVQREIVVTR
ncbi:MAG: Spo0B domain-containing protein [Chitinophagales bacterium]